MSHLPEVMSQNDNAIFVERFLPTPQGMKSLRQKFNIYHAIESGPGRNAVGRPGDLWLTLYPPTAYYKDIPRDGHKRGRWRLATFHEINQMDILHPQTRRLRLFPGPSGPTWRSIDSLSLGSLEVSIIIFFEQQGILDSLPGGSNNPIEIHVSLILMRFNPLKLKYCILVGELRDYIICNSSIQVVDNALNVIMGYFLFPCYFILSHALGVYIRK
jgi:hypothetical protein